MVLAQLAVDESAGYEPLIVILPVTMMKTAFDAAVFLSRRSHLRRLHSEKTWY